MHAQLSMAAAKLAEADALVITAGAGMGVDSGLPDFRGNQGFWRAYPFLAKRRVSFEEIANPVWFQKAPDLAWAFYGHRLALYRSTVPHGGFGQLLELARTKPHGFFVFTSNVDGQFQKAGFPPERIVECHGSIHHFQCCTPCTRAIWEATGERVQISEDDFRAVPPLPACPHCAGLARPNVLMFGDSRWVPDRTLGQELLFENWLGEIGERKVVVVEIGAGSAIPTVRHLSESLAGGFSAPLIRINPRDCEVPGHSFGIPMSAARGIAALIEQIFQP